MSVSLFTSLTTEVKLCLLYDYLRAGPVYIFGHPYILIT